MVPFPETWWGLLQPRIVVKKTSYNYPFFNLGKSVLFLISCLTYLQNFIMYQIKSSS